MMESISLAANLLAPLIGSQVALRSQRQVEARSYTTGVAHFLSGSPTAFIVAGLTSTGASVLIPSVFRIANHPALAERFEPLLHGLMAMLIFDIAHSYGKNNHCSGYGNGAFTALHFSKVWIVLRVGVEFLLEKPR